MKAEILVFHISNGQKREKKYLA